jgi:hypothetical protein
MKMKIMLLSIILISCSNKITNIDKCKENIAFKKEWDENINFLINYYNVRQNESVYEEAIGNYSITEFSEEGDRYLSALEFISKYIPISYEYKTSFSGKLPYSIYLKEKERWNNWYEKNKCSDIQLK